MPSDNWVLHTSSPFLLFYILTISAIVQISHLQLASCSIDSSRPELNLVSNVSRAHDEDQHGHHNHFPIARKDQAQESGDQSKSRSKAKHASNRQLGTKCSLSELDRCSAQLIGLGQSTNSMYPDSMQELNSVYCPKFREAVSCIKDNSECFKPFERQIVNWVLTSTRKMNYKRCKNENEKIRFLRLTNSCFSSMRNPMDECMRNYIGGLDAIADYSRDLERLSDDDIQIQLSCCANRRFKQCIMDGAKQKCQSHESLRKLRRSNSNSSQRVARKQLLRVVQNTMDDLKSTLDEMALTGPEFICTKVDEKFCRSRFDGRYTNRLSRHKSIVPAMLKIYANK